MARGRRSRGYSKDVRFRCTDTEREAFEMAAELSNVPLSTWLRLALREAAERRLASAGQKPAWLEQPKTEG